MAAAGHPIKKNYALQKKLKSTEYFSILLNKRLHYTKLKTIKPISRHILLILSFRFSCSIGRFFF